MQSNNLKIGQMVYWTRVHPSLGIYDLYDLRIRCVDTDWISAVDNKTKQAYLFPNSDIGRTVFEDRKQALKYVKDAKKNSNPVHFTTDASEE